MKPTRRKMLKTVALAAGLAAVPWAARGQAKASKEAMQYQDQPKNGQTCDSCANWIPGPRPDAPGACQVVEGPINPKGWCIAYAKKS
jgi:hypothetical protein